MFKSVQVRFGLVITNNFGTLTPTQIRSCHPSYTDKILLRPTVWAMVCLLCPINIPLEDTKQKKFQTKRRVRFCESATKTNLVWVNWMNYGDRRKRKRSSLTATYKHIAAFLFRIGTFWQKYFVVKAQKSKEIDCYFAKVGRWLVYYTKFGNLQQ